LPYLSPNPPPFSPTAKLTRERLDEINVNSSGFLWPEEVKLLEQVLELNQESLAFEDVDRGTLKESYFSSYIIPTKEHTPWVFKNISIPPGICQAVIEVLKLKIAAGVYEHSQ
ncbi:hypothetical protein HYDPIDRAFT_75131, partial [Hydnomerulius pinastri MD-312]